MRRLLSAASGAVATVDGAFSPRPLSLVERLWARGAAPRRSLLWRTSSSTTFGEVASSKRFGHIQRGGNSRLLSSRR
jgi:hypothetical protein